MSDWHINWVGHLLFILGVLAGMAGLWYIDFLCNKDLNTDYPEQKRRQEDREEFQLHVKHLQRMNSPRRRHSDKIKIGVQK